MTKPSTAIRWATDATFIADADPWAGAANKIDPGAVRRGEGVEPDTFPAEYANFMWNSWGEHLTYVEDVLEATDTIPAVTRTIVLHGSIFQSFQKTTGANPTLAIVPAAGTGHRISIDATDPVILLLPLNRLLPNGAVVTDINLLIDPGTHTVGGRFSQHSATPDFFTPAMGTHFEDQFALTTGATLEVLNLTTDFSITSTIFRYLAYDSVDLTAAADIIEGLEIQFTDPGPRNF